MKQHLSFFGFALFLLACFTSGAVQEPPLGQGTLTITTNVENVLIQIDGELKGPLPGKQGKYLVPAGWRTVDGIKEGYTTFHTQIEVRANSETPLRMELTAGARSFEVELETLVSKATEQLGDNKSQAEKSFNDIFLRCLNQYELKGLTPIEKNYFYNVFVHLANLSAQRKDGRKIQTLVGQYSRVHFLFPGRTEVDNPDVYLQAISDLLVPLMVTSDVPDVELRIENEAVERIRGEKQFFLRPGTYTIEMRKENYTPARKTVALQLGDPPQSLVFDGRLEKLTLLLLFQDPVEVRVNEGPHLPSESYEQLRTRTPSVIQHIPQASAGIDLSRLRFFLYQYSLPQQWESEPKIDLEFFKDRFTRDIYQINLSPSVMEKVNRLEGYFIPDKVFRLDPVKAKLRVESEPPGAKVFLARAEFQAPGAAPIGEPVGRTPFEDRFPVGQYVLEVKDSVGRFRELISLNEKETRTVKAPLKPALVYLGVLADGGVPTDGLASRAERIGEKVKSITSFWVEFDSPAKFEDWEQLWRLIDGASLQLAEQKQVEEHLKKLKQVYRTSLLLLGRFRTDHEYLANDVTLYLFNTENPRPDRWSLNLGESEKLNGILSKIKSSQTRSLFRNWTGVRLFDTGLKERSPVISSVVQGSPAEAARLQPSDILVSVDGAHLDTEAFYQYVQKKAPDIKLRLLLQRKGQPIGTELQIQTIPAVIDPGREEVNNSILLDFLSIQARHAKKDERHQLALLNIALCHMAYGNWSKAIVHFNEVDSEAIKSLSPGYIDYFKGRCFEELDLDADAQTNYERARQREEGVLNFEFFPSSLELANWRIRFLR